MSLDATRWAWTVKIPDNKECKKSNKRLVLLSLADRAAEDHTCFPSAKRLVADTCLDRKTVLAVISELITDGLLKDTGERKGVTKQVRVLKLIGVHGREDTVPTKEQYQQRNRSNNGTNNNPAVGTDNGTADGTRNLSIESTNESTNIYKGKFNFANALVSQGADQKLISEYMEVRKAKKAVNSETAFKSLISEQQKSGLTLNQVLEHCVVNSWKGFKAEWIKNQNTVHGQQNKPSRWDEIQQLIAKEEQGNDSYGY